MPFLKGWVQTEPHTNGSVGLDLPDNVYGAVVDYAVHEGHPSLLMTHEIVATEMGFGRVFIHWSNAHDVEIPFDYNIVPVSPSR